VTPPKQDSTTMSRRQVLATLCVVDAIAVAVGAGGAVASGLPVSVDGEAAHCELRPESGGAMTAVLHANVNGKVREAYVSEECCRLLHGGARFQRSAWALHSTCGGSRMVNPFAVAFGGLMCGGLFMGVLIGLGALMTAPKKAPPRV
jgi:hypothetical protein